MNYNKAYFLSLPLQWLVIIVIMITLVGCGTEAERQDIVRTAFSNQCGVVKATTYIGQYIVQCDDGSIWEVKTSESCYITYKNCLFDPLYRLPLKSLFAPILLEKDETNGVSF